MPRISLDGICLLFKTTKHRHREWMAFWHNNGNQHKSNRKGSREPMWALQDPILESEGHAQWFHENCLSFCTLCALNLDEKWIPTPTLTFVVLISCLKGKKKNFQQKMRCCCFLAGRKFTIGFFLRGFLALSVAKPALHVSLWLVKHWFSKNMNSCINGYKNQ